MTRFTGHIRVSGVAMSPIEIKAMCVSITDSFGMRYGYLVQELDDTTVTSFLMTLCGHPRRPRNVTVEKIAAFVKGFVIGRYGITPEIRAEGFPPTESPSGIAIVFTERRPM